MTILCGVDEAGRGPLVGPMVMCGYCIAERDEDKLLALGVKDSKLLTKEKREELFEQLQNIAHSFEIISVSAAEVDDAVNGNNGSNLNKLEAVTTAQILNKLKPKKVIVDAPSNNIASYKEFLSSKITEKMELVLEHKADLNNPVVAAASILAKVTRDRAIEELKKDVGVDFGSGYLSDPKTKKFLEAYHDKPENKIMRKSWQPFKDLAKKKFQSNLASFSEKIDKHADIKEKLLALTSEDYVEIPVKSSTEVLRIKGACTITLYTNGNVLVQGPEAVKKSLEKRLGI